MKKLQADRVEMLLSQACVNYANDLKTLVLRTHPKERGENRSTHDVRRICRLSLEDRSRSVKDINGIIRTAGVQITDRTVRKKLCENGLQARRPRKKPFVSETETEAHRLGFST